MAGEKHLRLVAGGGWTTGAIVNEEWAVGVRLVIKDGTVDDIGTMQDTWSVDSQIVNRTETHWGIVGNWKLSHLGATFSPDDYLNDQAAPAFATWMQALPAHSDQCRMDWLKLSVIGTNGREVPPPGQTQGTPMTLTWTSSSPAGLNGGDLLPIQNALVASHRTHVTGRRGRGRMFIPGFTASIVNHQGEMTSTSTDNTRAAQIALLEALALDVGGLVSVSVRPVVTGLPFTNYGVIDEVRVGNVMDTQRRRRGSLVETYSIGAVTY